MAAQRLGNDAELEEEFGKMDARRKWIDRLFSMLVGCQALTFFLGTTWLISRSALAFAWEGLGHDFGSRNPAVAVGVFGLVYVTGLVGDVAVCSWLARQNGDRLGPRLDGVLSRKATLVPTGRPGRTAVGERILDLTQILVARIFGSQSLSDAYASMAAAGTIVPLLTAGGTLGLALMARRRSGAAVP